MTDAFFEVWKEQHFPASEQKPFVPVGDANHASGFFRFDKSGLWFVRFTGIDHVEHEAITFAQLDALKDCECLQDDWRELPDEPAEEGETSNKCMVDFIAKEWNLDPAREWECFPTDDALRAAGLIPA